MVYVLMANLDGEDRPVGVVDDEAKARAFYDADTTRDYIPFEMNSIVGQDSQNPGEVAPPSSIKPNLDHLENLNKSITDMRERLRAKPKKHSALQHPLLNK
jgi:hypothetical protein